MWWWSWGPSQWLDAAVHLVDVLVHVGVGGGGGVAPVHGRVAAVSHSCWCPGWGYFGDLWSVLIQIPLEADHPWSPHWSAVCLRTSLLEPHSGHAHPPRLLTRPLAHWRLSHGLKIIGKLSLRLLRPVTRHGRGRVPGPLASDFLLELLHFRILIMDHRARPQVLDWHRTRLCTPCGIREHEAGDRLRVVKHRRIRSVKRPGRRLYRLVKKMHQLFCKESLLKELNRTLTTSASGLTAKIWINN